MDGESRISSPSNSSSSSSTTKGGTSSCLGREHGMVSIQEHCMKHMGGSKWDVFVNDFVNDFCVDDFVNDFCPHLIKKILQIIHSSRRIATQNWRRKH